MTDFDTGTDDLLARRDGHVGVITFNRPERRNAVKVLLFLDIGGSMDPHVKVVEELFSAGVRSARRHLSRPRPPPCRGDGSGGRYAARPA